MRSSSWLNRGTALGLLVGLLLGGGGVALWHSTREQPKEQGKVDPPTDAPKPEPKPGLPEPKPPTGIDPLLDSKKKAQLRSQTLDKAIKAYVLSSGNPGVNDEDKLPQAIDDLVAPPFGGPSFLENGRADTLDPWGRPYTLNQMKRPDGTPFILVQSTAPDGTPVTQYGIGVEKAFPVLKQ